MLRRLYIRDYVIVDQLELEFAASFGALTGETGAGKSILVDALSLALGERADAASVRNDCDKAEVTAEFVVCAGSPLAAWLRANDFDDDACLLRRVMESSGRSRGYLNGVPATLGQMREPADFLATSMASMPITACCAAMRSASCSTASPGSGPWQARWRRCMRPGARRKRRSWRLKGTSRPMPASARCWPGR